MPAEPHDVLERAAAGLLDRQARPDDQLFEGAYRHDGFEGASVDDIARTAGISKASLYRHFPDKAAFFVAVAERECPRQAAVNGEIECAGRCLKDILTEVAHETISFALSDLGQSVFRIANAEAGRFPELGNAFHAAGTERSCRRLAPVLAAAAELGLISAPHGDFDAGFAAEIFLSMCKANSFTRQLFGVGRAPGNAEIDTHIERIVALFLKAYDFRPPGTNTPA